MDSGISTAEQARLLVTYAGERMADAEACAAIERFYPACVMVGASIEAVLLAQALAFEVELRAASLWQDGTDPLSWGIEPMIQRAVKLGWLPATMASVPNQRITEVLEGESGDAIRFIQYLRNITAHPGKHVGEAPWLTVGKTEWELAQGIAGVVFGHLKEVLDRSTSLQ